MRQAHVRHRLAVAIRPYIEFVEACDFLSAEERGAILYENADRLY